MPAETPGGSDVAKTVETQASNATVVETAEVAEKIAAVKESLCWPQGWGAEDEDPTLGEMAGDGKCSPRRPQVPVVSGLGTMSRSEG